MAGIVSLQLAVGTHQPLCRLDHNAAWANVDWTSNPIDPVAVKLLAEEMASRKIRYLYPFTTYVKQTEFSAAYSHAAEFVHEFKKHNTSTKLIAWVGVPLKRAGPYGINGWTDLNDPGRRRFIMDFVKAKLIDEAGFDGVQFNVETTFDQNTGLLIFLEEARTALGPNAILGVTGETWYANSADIPVGDRSWSANYYHEVALRVDQIAAMTYDSQMAEANAYRLWLRDQIVGISHSIAGTHAELLIGLSISREASAGHHPDIENVENALMGICMGVNALNVNDHPIGGAAMYASWEATNADWVVWEQWLVGGQP